MDNVATQQEAFKNYAGPPSSPLDIARWTMLRKYCLETINQSDKKLNILDVGGGGGELLLPFKENANLYLVDLSQECVALAISKGYSSASICNIEHDPLPWDNEFFDLVVSSEVIEHLYSPDNYLAEINRVLKTNGDFVLTFPNVNCIMSHVAMLALDYPPRYSSRYKSVHSRDYSLRVVTKLLNNFKFSVLKQEGIALLALNKMLLGKKLASFFPRFSEMVIVRSRKSSNCTPDPRTVIWDSQDI